MRYRIRLDRPDLFCAERLVNGSWMYVSGTSANSADEAELYLLKEVEKYKAFAPSTIKEMEL